MSPLSWSAARAAAWRAVCAALFVSAACGRAGAVVGGTEGPAPLASRTVMVLSSRGGMCSGIVLAPDAVLTAGHCAVGGDLRLHWRAGTEPVLVEPAAVAVHPGYDPGAIRARRRSTDLALIRVSPPLPADRFAVATLAAGPVAKGAGLRVGGYGVAREGDARSTGTFRTAALAAVEPFGPSRILLWMEAPGGGQGPCTGDSGGPAALEDGTVAGVVTWSSGAGRAACGGRSQAVLVGPERGWIDRTLAGWGTRAAWR